MLKRIVDVAMTILMLCLMAYQVTGEFAHEWVGIGETFLVIIHQILNRKWYVSIFKGKYKTLRVFILMLNFLLLVSFVATAVCGISMSNYAVPFMYGLLPVSLVRTMHLSLSYWAFIFMGLHIGIHLPAMVDRLNLSKQIRMGALILFCILSGIGFFIFIRSGVFSYLTFSTHFAFLDFDKSGVLVFFENVTMLIFWSFIGMQSFNFLKNGVGGKREE